MECFLSLFVDQFDLFLVAHFRRGAKRLAESSGLWLLPAEALHTFVSKPPQRILSCPPTSSALQGRILQRWLLLPAVRNNKTNQSEPIFRGVLNITKLKAILKCDFQSFCSSIHPLCNVTVQCTGETSCRPISTTTAILACFNPFYCCYHTPCCCRSLCRAKIHCILCCLTWTKIQCILECSHLFSCTARGICVAYFPANSLLQLQLYKKTMLWSLFSRKVSLYDH